jgi:hypothetical protein
MLHITQLQRIGRDEMESNILSFYERLMRRYLSDRDRIPPDRLTEIRYEDLERDPVGTAAGIYRALGISGFEEAEPKLKAHVEAQSHYRKNVHDLTEDVVEKIGRRWQFAFDAWKYDTHPPDADTH